MSTKAARREYLQAVAEFQQACHEFSAGMARVLDPEPAKASEDPGWITRALGPSKPPKRAPARTRQPDTVEKKA